MSIQLTIAHERLWWQVAPTDDQPERWEISANVWGMEESDDEARHVGDVSLALADLTMERNFVDASVLGEWALEFISDLVADPDRGTLHPDLERQFSPGPPHLVVVRHVSVSEPWRGFGLGAALTASALIVFSRYARLAACRVSPDYFADAGDPVSAELASVRIGAAMELMGFRLWRGVYVIDLRSPALHATHRRVTGQWWPSDDEADDL